MGSDGLTTLPMSTDNDVRVLAYERLLAAGETLLAAASDGLAEHGLTITQFRALNVLRVRGPLPQTEVAKYIWRTVANVGALAVVLEKSGLIALRRDESDRRAVIVSLTERAHELLEGIVPEHISQIGRVMRGLTGTECEQLLTLIDKVSPEESG